ncbi:hypothetical protein M3231_15475 [Neobacillus mesonae]|nr:hypothetical protein [Neobacillus mesonae]
MTKLLKISIVALCLLSTAACASEPKPAKPNVNAEEQTASYPFIIWGNGSMFKIITNDSLPKKLASEELGKVTATQSSAEQQEYQDGVSNYLKEGSAVYRLKDADDQEVILVEHGNELYKAVRID